ncbi:hypothetical protein MCHI_001004 [Candidatus Magnetoovum chiemensis]|nr:hypothetical protein MCHI_001004 [Candidatus Magnetoovum chiemensis]
MNKKILYIAVMVIILLIVAVTVKRKPDTSLMKTVKLQRLISNDIKTADISKIELSISAKKDDKTNNALTLVQKNDKWIIPSVYNAAADKTKVEGFINTITALDGEFRSNEKDVLKDYGLDDASAMKISVYTKDKDKPSAVLLAGKNAGGVSVFVRKNDSSEVFVADKDLREAVGASSSDLAAAPDYKRFVNLNLFDLKKEDLTEISLNYLDLINLQFNKETVEKETAQTTETTKERNEAQKAQKWKTSSKDINFTLKENGIENLISKISLLNANSINGNIKENKDITFNNPLMTLSLKYKDGKSETVSVIKNKDSNSDDYYVSKSDNDSIYAVSKSKINSLILKSSDVFDLNVIKLTKEDIDNITISGNGTFKLAHDADSKKWVFYKDNEQKQIEDAKINELVNAYSIVEAYGFITRPNALSKPEFISQINLTDKTGYTIKAESRADISDDLYLAETTKSKHTLILDKATVHKMFPKWVTEEK